MKALTPAPARNTAMVTPAMAPLERSLEEEDGGEGFDVAAGSVPVDAAAVTAEEAEESDEVGGTMLAVVCAASESSVVVERAAVLSEGHGVVVEMWKRTLLSAVQITIAGRPVPAALVMLKEVDRETDCLFSSLLILNSY